MTFYPYPNPVHLPFTTLAPMTQKSIIALIALTCICITIVMAIELVQFTVFLIKLDNVKSVDEFLSIVPIEVKRKLLSPMRYPYNESVDWPNLKHNLDKTGIEFGKLDNDSKHILKNISKRHNIFKSVRTSYVNPYELYDLHSLTDQLGNALIAVMLGIQVIGELTLSASITLALNDSIISITLSLMLMALSLIIFCVFPSTLYDIVASKYKDGVAKHYLLGNHMALIDTLVNNNDKYIQDLGSTIYDFMDAIRFADEIANNNVNNDIKSPLKTYIMPKLYDSYFLLTLLDQIRQGVINGDPHISDYEKDTPISMNPESQDNAHSQCIKRVNEIFSHVVIINMADMDVSMLLTELNDVNLLTTLSKRKSFKDTNIREIVYDMENTLDKLNASLRKQVINALKLAKVIKVQYEAQYLQVGDTNAMDDATRGKYYKAMLDTNKKLNK